jgi:hypothetical protein
MKKSIGLFFVFFLLGFISAANAQGIVEHTKKMERLGKLFHAPKSSKPEAVYSSSGKANRFKAMRAWIKSPSHRGIALKLGITVCRGGYCTRRNFR